MTGNVCQSMIKPSRPSNHIISWTSKIFSAIFYTKVDPIKHTIYIKPFLFCFKSVKNKSKYIQFTNFDQNLNANALRCL